MVDVLFFQARRRERLDWLAYKLLSRITECLFGLSVDQDDGPILIHNDHGVGR